MKKLLALITGIILFLPQITMADFVPSDEEENAANTFILDSDDTGGDVVLQFGASLAEFLKWNSSTLSFDFSDETLTLDASNVGAGADVNIIANQGSDNDGTIRYNSTANYWEISNDGGAFQAIPAGPTHTQNTDTGSTSAIFTLDSDNAGAGTNIDLVANQGSDSDGTLRYNATANQWEISNNGGVFNAISTVGGASSDFEAVYTTDTGNDLVTSNGTFTINTGTNDFIVDSNDWNVNAIGDIEMGKILTLDAINAGAGANVSIIANQGSDSDGTLRYDATTNRWEMSNNGGGYAEFGGWYGSENQIRLIPKDFLPVDGSAAIVAINGSYIAFDNTSDPTATIAIPSGFSATHVMVYGSDTGNTIEVFANAIADGTTATSLGTGVVGTEINITDLAATTTNYLSIQMSVGNGDQVYGGYVTITPTP